MNRRLLCVTAHPDDESGGFGGALLSSHREGIETNLLCFTDGQAAHYRGDAKDAADLGQRRRSELAEACDVLGVTRHEVLDYEDGELMKEAIHLIIGEVVQRIRLLRPQVVLTFGGDGAVNLHRDHTVISLATTAAFHWAGRPEFFHEQVDGGLAAYTPRKLYYLSTPFVAVRDRPELSNAAVVPWSLSLDTSGDLWEKKIEAFSKHTTQAGVLDRVREMIGEHKDYERYLLAAAPQSLDVSEDTALFQGVTAD
ncbi:PIG-L deacetylase family protein [Silvibacterium acidisoli]|uniref:PIG-L deacetylase family protein n=1 Tax=Acidobacteriaceae bacterium ZG23-2 TaxID=2883246 RepID=UPI00406C44E0